MSWRRRIEEGGMKGEMEGRIEGEMEGGREGGREGESGRVSAHMTVSSIW